MAAPVILVEASPRQASDGAPVAIRLAGGGASVPYHYDGQHWRAGITALPKSSAALDFDGEQLGGGAMAQAIALDWAAPSRAALAELSAHYWTDAPIVVRVGPEGAALPPVVATGLVLETAIARGVLTIALADQLVDLKRPLLVDRFAGTGGIEGPAEFAGLIKSRAWGRCFNVPGRQIDAANQIWCFGDPRRRWDAFVQVRDKGVGGAAAALTVLPAGATAEATFAALQAAPAPQGGGVLCPSIACVKWWTEPAGDLHADIRGETAGGYVETAPEIVARIVASRSTIAFADGAIAAAVAARPGPFGWRVDNDSATAAAEISEMLGGVSLSWPMVDGAIVFRPWDWAPAMRIGRSFAVSRRSTVKPTASRKLGYRRNWSPMARGDLAAIVLVRDVEYEDGTSLTDAVDNAGKTADWDKVGGDGKPADNATNSADPNSPFGPGTVSDALAQIAAFDATLAALEQDIQTALEPYTAQLAADIQAARDRIEAVKAILESSDAAIRQDIANIEVGDPGGAIAEIRDRVAVLVTDADALAGRVSTVETTFGDFDARVVGATTAASNATSAVADLQSALSASIGDVSTRITNEATASAQRDSGLASQIQNLSSSVSGAYGEIGREAGLRIARDSALTQLIDSQASTLGNLSGSISSVQQTLATQTQSIATLQTSVAASSAPNLLTNGGFTDGTNNWYLYQTQGNWELGRNSSGYNFAQHYFDAYADTGFYQDVYNIEPGLRYSLSMEQEHDGGCKGHCTIQWWSAGFANFLGYGGETPENVSGWGNRANLNGSTAINDSRGQARCARIQFYPSAGNGTRRIARVMFQRSDVASGYTDAAGLDSLGRAVASVQSRVDTIQSAIVTTQGRTEAYLKQTAVAGDGRAEIVIYASDGNGNPIGRILLGGDVIIRGSLLLDGSLDFTKAKYGFTGVDSLYYYQQFTDNSQTDFSAGPSGLGIEISEGSAIDGRINVWCTNLNNQGRVFAKVIRLSDGTAVWGGDDGLPIVVGSNGNYAPVPIEFSDGVPAETGQQYDLRFRCEGGANIRSTMRTIKLTEKVRAKWSQIHIVAPASQGPGAGNAGGGQINGDASGSGGTTGTNPSGGNSNYGGLRGRTAEP